MGKILPFLLALTLLLSACGAPAELGYQQVTAQQAQSLMEETGDWILLDVRTQAEYEQAHIPGAVCVPDKEQLILVYCRSGNRSKQASEKLVQLGYTNVVEFGGIINWPGETVSGSM